MKKYGAFIAFGLGCLFVVSVIALLEIYFGHEIRQSRLYQPDRSDQDEESSLYFSQHPPRYGTFLPAPESISPDLQFKGPLRSMGSSFDWIKIVDPVDCIDKGFFIKSCRQIMKTSSGELIFDVHYSLDSFERRITPGEAQKKTDKFMITLGDSMIFGIGIPDNGTKSFFLSEKFPEYRQYNYGFVSAYMGELLSKVEKINKAEIPEKEGVALYFMENFNLIRNAGHLTELSRWAGFKPYYEEDRNGMVRTFGSFGERRPLMVLLSKLVLHSNILRYFKVQPKLSDKDLRVSAKLIKAIKEALRAKGVTKFYLVFGPGPATFAKYQFFKYLEDYKINYFDISGWEPYKYVPGNPIVPVDGHPSALANQKLIEHLTPHLKKESA